VRQGVEWVRTLNDRNSDVGAVSNVCPVSNRTYDRYSPTDNPAEREKEQLIVFCHIRG